MLVCHQSFITKRSIAPLYDLTYRYSADFDWCIRCMKQAGRIYNTRMTLSNFLDGGVSTTQRKASLKERYDIMCLVLWSNINIFTPCLVCYSLLFC